MPQRELARALADQAVARLGPRLLPSAVPDDVAEFRNGAGSAVGSLDVRRGAPGSSVQFHLPFRPVVELCKIGKRFALGKG
jgi:red chlorophyll catabolite reductase